jgi:hypothetical protein
MWVQGPAVDAMMELIVALRQLFDCSVGFPGACRLRIMLKLPSRSAETASAYFL